MEEVDFPISQLEVWLDLVQKELVQHVQKIGIQLGIPILLGINLGECDLWELVRSWQVPRQAMCLLQEVHYVTFFNYPKPCTYAHVQTQILNSWLWFYAYATWKDHYMYLSSDQWILYYM